MSIDMSWNFTAVKHTVMDAHTQSYLKSLYWICELATWEGHQEVCRLITEASSKQDKNQADQPA